MGANAVNLVRIMEGRDQPRALGAARRTRLGSSPYRRGARRPVLQSKTCLMSLGSQEVAPASVRKRDPPPTPLHLHRVCFCPQDRNYRNYSATRTSNWKFPTADDIREDLVHIGLAAKYTECTVSSQMKYIPKSQPACCRLSNLFPVSVIGAPQPH